MKLLPAAHHYCRHDYAGQLCHLLLQDKILDSKLQSPSLGISDLPCLPGHWVGGHPQKLGVIQSGGRSISTAGNVYRKNSRDCLTSSSSGSRAYWVWMQVGRIKFLESEATLPWAQSPRTTHRTSLERAVEMPMRCECLLIPEWSIGIEYCPLSCAEWPLENIGPPLAPSGKLGPPRRFPLNLLRQTSILVDY